MTTRPRKSTTATTSKRGPYCHTSVRLDAQTQAGIDALRPHFSTDWRQAATSDILRALILVGLDVVEKQGNANNEDSASTDDKAK